MKKQNETKVSVQSPFAIMNPSDGSYVISPPLYGRVSPAGQESYFEEVNDWRPWSFGRILSTATRKNSWGAEMSYTGSSEMISMSGKNHPCMFYIAGDEKLVSYTSMTPYGSVRYSYVVFEDIIGGVVLEVVPDSAKTLDSKDTITTIDDMHYLQDPGVGTEPSIVTKKTNSIVIPNTERFSFLSNVSINFFRPLYQWTTSGGSYINHITQNAFGVFGGYFSLTGDDSMLYPEDITFLEIVDGFSQGVAVIKFDHNVIEKTVEITVLDHTSRVCDIREVNYGGIYFPHTICFAL